MLVMKFGGTSVGSGERILHVARVILAHLDQRPVVVTSAMSGVTDALLALASAASAGDADACAAQLTALVSRHHDAARTIDQEAGWKDLHHKLDLLRATVEDVLAKQDQSANACNMIVSWGERLAVVLVAGALRSLGQPALAWDSPLIATDEHARPLTEETQQLAGKALTQAGDALLVAPGFIAQMPDGHITTLGRGGSDYSATLLAAALQAGGCWIYTDVDGVLSADPRIVQDAQILPFVSPQTAGRLSYSGAKVLHPQSVAPVARLGIPLRVRNTFRPDHPGTLIADLRSEQHSASQAITGRRNLAAIVLTGDGLPEVPHLFGRICQAMTSVGIEIILSVHPGTGYDPQILVNKGHAPVALERLSQEFAGEYAQGLISSISTREGLALCTLIAEELGSHALAHVQRTLAAEDIVPLVQTAFPSALSFALHERELDRAIRSIHREVIEPALRQHTLSNGHGSASVPWDDDEASEQQFAKLCS